MDNPNKPALAKAGDKASDRARIYIHNHYPGLKGLLVTKEDWTVQPKTDAKNGQWACIVCGKFFAEQ